VLAYIIYNIAGTRTRTRTAKEKLVVAESGESVRKRRIGRKDEGELRVVAACYVLHVVNWFSARRVYV